MTLFGPKREIVHEFDSEDAVIVTFKHARQAKGPAYANIRHKLYPGEQPTAIRDTAKCVFWNLNKGYNRRPDVQFLTKKLIFPKKQWSMGY